MGAQKNHLIEAVLLSTHNICFNGEIRKIILSYALLFRHGNSEFHKRSEYEHETPQ